MFSLEQSLQHGFLTTNGVKLHYVTQGQGPLMVMLHGFPEFWYSWRHQIPEFATDHKVVAVDLRGYNESDKPAAKSAYTMPEFIQDIKGLIEGLGYESCTLVGHDWGGAIAWSFAHAYPAMVDRLIVLNIPHPAKFAEALRSNPKQWLRSLYVLFFQIPGLSEWALQWDDYHAIAIAFTGMAVDQTAFSSADLEAYKDAAAKRGALTAMLNYYRNAFSNVLSQQNWSVIEVPTLLIWGEKDIALGKELTYGTEAYVEDLQIRYIPNCSHWVQHERPDLVNQHIREFLKH